MREIELQLEGITMEVNDETHELFNKVACKINQFLGFLGEEDEDFDFLTSDNIQDRDAYQLAAMTAYYFNDMAIH